jgi:hypothetical protein
MQAPPTFPDDLYEVIVFQEAIRVHGIYEELTTVLSNWDFSAPADQLSAHSQIVVETIQRLLAITTDLGKYLNAAEYNSTLTAYKTAHNIIFEFNSRF